MERRMLRVQRKQNDKRFFRNFTGKQTLCLNIVCGNCQGCNARFWTRTEYRTGVRFTLDSELVWNGSGSGNEQERAVAGLGLAVDSTLVQNTA